jgi:hypothetical protein
MTYTWVIMGYCVALIQFISNNCMCFVIPKMSPMQGKYKRMETNRHLKAT